MQQSSVYPQDTLVWPLPTVTQLGTAACLMHAVARASANRRAARGAERLSQSQLSMEHQMLSLLSQLIWSPKAFDALKTLANILYIIRAAIQAQKLLQA